MNSKRKNKTKTMITLVIILGIVAASAVVIPRYVKAQNVANSTQSSTETRTITVGTQDLEKVISGTGQILTGDEETLTLDNNKTVDEVLVKEGQAVKKDAVLSTYTNGTELTAPFNGVVGPITISDNTGATSRTTNTASNTITVKSTDTLVTELSVDETDLRNLKIGQAAAITLNALPDTKYTGKVTAISETGTYSNGSSTFKVTITLDKTTNVKIGMSAEIKIVIASVKNAVAVPIEAVKGSGDNARVMVVQSDGSVSPVSVKLGLANDAYVQITSGLAAGDTIQYTVQSGTGSNGIGGMGAFGNLKNMTGNNRSTYGGGTRSTNGTGGNNSGSGNQSTGKTAQ
ncbi:MAG: efflux RND transporter periplasmic adaptor subunit [Peptococcaceae bacterium]|nr:efflux RND transporter periplasmic adaptor subunit [Peptococcaceae bacterium]